MDNPDLGELLEKSRERAHEIIDSKAGRGVVIYRSEDGNIDMVSFGGEEEMSKPVKDQLQDSMDLILSLVMAYLPGSSVESTNMHNNVMAGLRAINTNVTSLFEFLRQAFPQVRLQAVKQKEESDSGLIL
jgi:hypothetical protein